MQSRMIRIFLESDPVGNTAALIPRKEWCRDRDRRIPATGTHGAGGAAPPVLAGASRPEADAGYLVGVGRRTTGAGAAAGAAGAVTAGPSDSASVSR